MRPFLCWHNRAPFLLRFSSKLPAPRPCYFWYLDQMAPGKQHRVPNLLTCMPWHGRVIASLCHTCYMYKSLGCSVALIAGCACNQQQSSFIPIFLFISCSFCSADTYRAAAGKQVALVYSFFWCCRFAFLSVNSRRSWPLPQILMCPYSRYLDPCQREGGS